MPLLNPCQTSVRHAYIATVTHDPQLPMSCSLCHQRSLMQPHLQLCSGVSSMFNDELRSTFAERFGERSLSQTVPHWQLGGERTTKCRLFNGKFLVVNMPTWPNLSKLPRAANCSGGSQRLFKVTMVFTWRFSEDSNTDVFRSFFSHSCAPFSLRFTLTCADLPTAPSAAVPVLLAALCVPHCTESTNSDMKLHMT